MSNIPNEIEHDPILDALYLIPWPQTSWSEADRIASRTPMPLSDAGQNTANLWAKELAESGVNVIFTSNEQTSLETAEIISGQGNIKRKTIPELQEVDAGLWDGLTSVELKRRYPKIFKKWQSDPSSVCPPEGEDLKEAFQRLKGALEWITWKQAAFRVAVVVGPYAFGLIRCMVESIEPDKMRTMIQDHPAHYFNVGTLSEWGVTVVAGEAGSDISK